MQVRELNNCNIISITMRSEFISMVLLVHKTYWVVPIGASKTKTGIIIDFYFFFVLVVFSGIVWELGYKKYDSGLHEMSS